MIHLVQELKTSLFQGSSGISAFGVGAWTTKSSFCFLRARRSIDGPQYIREHASRDRIYIRDPLRRVKTIFTMPRNGKANESGTGGGGEQPEPVDPAPASGAWANGPPTPPRPPAPAPTEPTEDRRGLEDGSKANATPKRVVQVATPDGTTAPTIDLAALESMGLDDP